MSGEFDSRRDLQSANFKRRPQMLVKLSFRELCDSKLFGLHSFDTKAISLSLKKVKTTKVDCEFMRNQSFE